MSKLCLLVIIMWLHLLSTNVKGQPQLLADINTTETKWNRLPEGVVGIQDLLIFSMSGEYGQELYGLNILSDELILIADIMEGQQSSHPTNFTVLNDLVFFTASSFQGGKELWRTDGTLEGTFEVVDIAPGQFSSSPSDLVVFGDELYFKATNEFPVKSLWKTDGTSSGSEQVSGDNVDVQELVASSNYLFFTSNSAVLWKTDGTVVEIVKNMSPAYFSSHLGGFTSVGNRIFFPASTPSHGEELWVSDGTGAGTYMVKDIHEGTQSTYPSEIIAGDNEVYFISYENVSERSLWKSDGTEENTEKIIGNIWPSGLTIQLTYNGGLIYFFAEIRPSYDEYLWVSDGTTQGTAEVVEATGQSSVIISDNQSVYCTVENEDYGWELWKMGDGLDTSNRILIFDGYPSDRLSIYDDYIFYYTNDYWKYSLSTQASNHVISSQINTIGSGPFGFTAFDDKVYFSADVDYSSDEDIWVTDGSSEGTNLVDAFGEADVRYLTKSGDYLFLVENYKNLVAINSQDNTSRILLEDAASNILNLIDLNGNLYFTFDTQVAGQLWKSNGTFDGTTLVKEFPDAFFSNSSFSHFSTTKSDLYFTLFDPEYGLEVWTSDGTEEGTKILKDVTPGTESTRVDVLIGIDDYIFFKEQNVDRFWISDGSEEGTELFEIKDLDQNISGSFPRNFKAVGNQLYFAASTFGFNAPSGNKLWVTDGQTTSVILEDESQPTYSNPDRFTSVGDNIYFTAETWNLGRELWRFDREVEKAIFVQDMFEGTLSGFNSYHKLLEYKNELYFTASSNVFSHSLFKANYVNDDVKLVLHFAKFFNDHSYVSGPMSRLYPMEDAGGFIIAGSTIRTGSEIWFYPISSGQNYETSLAVDENTEIGRVVGQIDIEGIDDLDDFRLVAGATSPNSFAVDELGIVTVLDNSFLDHEVYKNFELELTASSGSDQIIIDLTIKVNDINEAPSINEDQEFSLPITSKDGFELGAVKAQDPEQNILSFEIVSSDPEEAFSILQNGTLVLSNSESIIESNKTEFSLVVSANDGGLRSEGTVTVNLTESVIEDDGFEIFENRPNGYVIARLINLNDNDEWTLSIKSGNKDTAFEIEKNGDLVVKDGSKIDYELNQSFELVVEASNGVDSDEATYSITLIDVNEAPVLSKTMFSFDENPSVQMVIGILSGTDPEDDELIYSILSGNGDNNYAITDNTLLANDPRYFDFESFTIDTLIVSISDGSLSETGKVIITLLDIDEPLIFIGDTLLIDENSPLNEIVGQLSADDPEGVDASFTILSQSPLDAFSIDAMDNLIVLDSTALDFESHQTFTLSIEASDGSFTDIANLIININDVFEIVNDKPVFTDQSFGVHENIPIGTEIGTLVATDSIKGPLSYHIISGNEQGAVLLSQNSGLLTVHDFNAFDFEVNSSLMLEIEVSDGELNETATISINILDIDEPPSTEDRVFEIDENSVSGSIVGQIEGTDEDGDDLIYFLDNGNDGAFLINDEGVITVGDMAFLNFEERAEYVLEVFVSDQNYTTSASATINILDVNDPPRFTNKLFEIEENQEVGTVVGNLEATDEDGDEITFVIRDGNVSNAFAITTDGDIVVSNEEAIDFEQRTTITLIVSALDGIVDFEDIVEIKITDLVDNILITGVDEIPIAKFYPNPTIDRLTVEGIEPIQQLRIVDMAGLIMTQLADPVRDRVVIDVSTFQAGMYILIVDHQAFKFMKL